MLHKITSFLRKKKKKHTRRPNTVSYYCGRCQGWFDGVPGPVGSALNVKPGKRSRFNSCKTCKGPVRW